MVLRQSERERRALGPAPAFGGESVRLRWDPDRGGWHSERQRPPLPAVTAPLPPARDPVARDTVARAGRGSDQGAAGWRRSGNC